MLVTIKGKKFEVWKSHGCFYLSSRGDIENRYFSIRGSRDIDSIDAIDFIHLMRHIDSKEWDDVLHGLLFAIEFANLENARTEMEKINGGAKRLFDELNEKFKEHQAAEEAKTAAQDPIAPEPPKGQETETDPPLNPFLEDDDFGIGHDIELPEVAAPPPFSMWRYLRRKALEYLPVLLVVIGGAGAIRVIDGWMTAKFVAHELKVRTLIEAVGHQEGAGQTAPEPKH